MYAMFYDGTIWRRINDVNDLYINGVPCIDVIDGINTIIDKYNHVNIKFKNSTMFIPTNNFILQVVDNK